MPLVIADRVLETSTTTGTGTLTLAGAVSGYRSFSVVGDGNTTYYTIVDETSGDWEVGIGTYTSSGTTLSRTTVLASSNANALVNFAAGTKQVFVTYPAGKAVYAQADGNVGIGTDSPAYRFVVSDGTITMAFAPLTGLGYFGTVSNHPLLFATNSIERLQISTAGVATFTGSTRVQAASNQDAVALAGRAGGTSSYAATITPTTLTANRTVTLPNADGTAVLDTATQTLTNKTTSGLTLNDGYTEEVYPVVDAAGVALSPTNGSIQTWTLGASRTPTSGTWAAGQSMTLMIDDGAAYTVTWTTLGVTWETNNGTAPTLSTTGYTVIVLWKVGTTIYGAKVG